MGLQDPIRGPVGLASPSVHLGIIRTWYVVVVYLVFLCLSFLVVVNRLVLVLTCLESPWWLVRSGQLDKAEHSIKKLSRKDQDVDASKTVAMMVRTNQHELENAPGTSFFDCFRGSDLRRTEIACIAWAIQVLSGSSFGNQGTYFFQQGQYFPLSIVHFAVLRCCILYCMLMRA